jgi:hypothetical protein
MWIYHVDDYFGIYLLKYNNKQIMKAIDIETKSVHKVISIDFESQTILLESSEYGRTRQDFGKVVLIREKCDPEILNPNKI